MVLTSIIILCEWTIKNNYTTESPLKSEMQKIEDGSTGSLGLRPEIPLWNHLPFVVFYSITSITALLLAHNLRDGFKHWQRLEEMPHTANALALKCRVANATWMRQINSTIAIFCAAFAWRMLALDLKTPKRQTAPTSSYWTWAIFSSIFMTVAMLTDTHNNAKGNSKRAKNYEVMERVRAFSILNMHISVVTDCLPARSRLLRRQHFCTSPPIAVDYNP